MDAHAVHQLDALDLFGAVLRGHEVLLRDDGGLLDEAVLDRAGQRIVDDHIAERYDLPAGRFDERCRGELQPEQRLEFAQGPDAGARAIAMRLVHQQHQVGQRGQIFEVALAEILRQPLDARRPSSAHFGVDLRDVEDVDLDAAEQAARAALLVVVAGHHFRNGDGELGDALEHVLRTCWA